jgi:putative methanogenesis marker protein 8
MDRQDRGRIPADAHRVDEHVVEAIGRTRIVIRQGKVVEVGEPLIRDCPLARRFAVPVTDFSPDAIRANIEHRIASFGMCTGARDLLSDRDFVLFGASELLATALRAGLISAVVLACDGAGTVIVTRPDLVQGIGGRMSGLARTTPIPEVITKIRSLGGEVLDPRGGTIDMPSGADLAAVCGHRHFAVTVASAEDAGRIRALHPCAVIFAVHTTGISREEAERMVAACDLVTACASRHLRDLGGSALMQAGTAIPVFAFTPAGKEVILAKLLETGSPVLVKGGRLPVAGGKGSPEPLV